MRPLIKEKLDNFFSNYKNRVYKPGQIILQPNKKISHIFYIQSGLVKQFALSSEGCIFTIQIFKPGCYIPFALYLNEIQNRYTYQTISLTEVQVAPVGEVDTFLKNNPEVLYDLTRRLSQAISGLLKKLERTTFDDAYTRVLSLLIYFAMKFGEKKDNGISTIIPFTHCDLASCLGVHRETISRQLTILQSKGIIICENRQIILFNSTLAEEELEKCCKN